MNPETHAFQQPTAVAERALELKPLEIMEHVKTFARERPHTALAAACAAGFLMGGGLTPRLLAAAAMIFARRHLRSALDEAVETATRSL